jgi:hypothetical protein
MTTPHPAPPMSNAQPIALTDEQMELVLSGSRPIPAARRVEFLIAVAETLRGQPIGNGVVYRAVCEVQRRYFSPPPDNLSRDADDVE